MKNEQIKPKSCYQCTYRRSAPGHHSSCIFNWNGSTHFPPEGDPDGIKNGWWIFPTDYNPMWMIGECMEFKSEEVVDRDKVKELPSDLKKYPVTKEELLLKARKTGKTEAMIQSMVHQLKNNENVGVAGCKDPAHILKRLTELGVSAEATVMSYWREPLDDSMLPGEQIDTGYLFKKKPVKCFECGEVIDPEWIKGDATLISCEKCIRKYLKEIKDIPERGLSHVYKFSNEMVVVYDNNGDQVPELQGVYSIKLYDKILLYSDENTIWEGF